VTYDTHETQCRENPVCCSRHAAQSCSKQFPIDSRSSSFGPVHIPKYFIFLGHLHHQYGPQRCQLGTKGNLTVFSIVPWTDRILHYLVPPEYERAADILPIINGLFVYIHATLVLAAITLKLVGTPGWSAETGRGWIRLLFSGNYLPRFSRAMLRDGQAYYL